MKTTKTNKTNAKSRIIFFAIALTYMIYDCHFEMTAQKFSYRESFSSARMPKILVTKMPRRSGARIIQNILRN